MKKVTVGALLAFGFTASGFTTLAVAAETGPVKVTQQSNVSVAKPKHGQSMTDVENKYGAPIEKFGAIGEPPITRWRYAEFTVYFEHDKVIHSVTHKS